MNRSTSFTGNILIPMQVVGLKFSEKEDVLLNPFQNLILEAIADGYSVEQIAQATLLTEHVIKTEIDQLVMQKLLESEEGMIKLSALSWKLLMVSRCVQSLNEEKQRVCVNMVTGALEGYDEDRFIKEKTKDALELLPRIRNQEIDGISAEENIEFFRTYFRTFDGMDEEGIEAVLTSVYVTFTDTGTTRFQVQPIFRLPCLIGEAEEDKIDGEQGTGFWVKGFMCRITFSVKSALPAVNDSVLLCLSALADSGLLSEKGVKLAAAWEACQKAEPMEAYYDYVSGCLQFNKPVCDSGKRKVNLELPLRYQLTEERQEKIIARARDYFSLPSELALKILDTIDSTYIINRGLEELWEVEHDETEVRDPVS